jgi:RimJ/RimL family protein N-acetyltransferase
LTGLDLPFSATELRTERTLLRPFAARDLADVAGLLGHEDVVRYLDWDLHSPQQAAAALDRWTGMIRLAGDGDGLHIAVEVDDVGVEAAAGRRVVGVIILMLDSASNRRLEIGWIFHPEVHGRGFATEAARAVLPVCFRRLRTHRVVAKLDARNTASARVAQRLGMRHEAVLREDHLCKGEWVSVAIYGLLAAEFLAARAEAAAPGRPGEEGTR